MRGTRILWYFKDFKQFDMHKKMTHSAKHTSYAQIDRMRTVGLVWLGRLIGGGRGGRAENRRMGERGSRKSTFLLIIHELT